MTVRSLLVLAAGAFAILAACSHASTGLVKPMPAKRIALSFDDAPRGDGPRFTGDERAVVLVDALEKSQSGPVVFFVTTRGFDRPGGKDRIEYYAAAGHLIGNHSHSHLWLSRSGTDEYINDIDKAEQHLTGIENRRQWFRFPYLDEGRLLEKRDAVREALSERRLANGYVTVDNYDWYIESKWQQAVNAGRDVDIDVLRDAYVDMLMDAVRFYDEAAIEVFQRSPVHMLLLHENDLAALFIDDLILALRAGGWEIVSPDEAYADPVADIVPETLRAGQGRVAALAIEAGREPQTLSHLAIEEEDIDAMLSERGVFGPPANDE